nr:MAG TPA: hypothetical protein [Caudoviricetes sp.]
MEKVPFTGTLLARKICLKVGGSQYPFNSTNLLAITFLRLFI